jgi:hypothetical protein
MVGSNIATINGKPESSRTYIKQRSGICQVHPRSWLFVSLVRRNMMMAAQCRNSLPRPAAVPAKSPPFKRALSSSVFDQNSMGMPLM